MLARNKFILAPNLVSGMRDNAKKLFEALILWSGHVTEEYTTDNFIYSTRTAIQLYFIAHCELHNIVLGFENLQSAL